MVKGMIVAGCAALSITMIGGQAAQAQAVAPPIAQSAPEFDAFDQAMAAKRVADFGRRQHDPEALLVAARMLQEVPFRDKAAGPAGATTSPGESATFTAEGLFSEARALAGGDPQLLTRIRLAESAGARGVLSSAFGLGLVRIVQDVGARAIYGFAVQARGGTPLKIGAIGDVKTKMVMRLRDQNGKVVCLDDNGDYAPVCTFNPRASGPFKVEIVNRSDTPTRAVILSN
ncbi:MAG TPA: hypothetical protein VFC47_02490 [Caulobacteraceae bacterium]|nr:hypothetical protein [Caulobacteraceae bacterium]